MATKQERIEYINTTGSVDVWVDHSTDYQDKPEPVCVKPGESVFLTKDDELRNKRQSKEIFSNGLLRRAGLTKDIVAEIDIRNEMAEIEIREFVKRSNIIKIFGSKLRKIDSLNTLTLILNQVKEQNKTYNYIVAVEKRVNKIEEEQENFIK